MIRHADVQRKLDCYTRFWNRSPVERPLIGFSVGGWFPLQSYRAMQRLRGKAGLTPEDLHPEEFLPDYEGVVALWDGVEDDMIRGVAPIPPFPPTVNPIVPPLPNGSVCCSPCVASKTRSASSTAPCVKVMVPLPAKPPRDA